MSYIYEDTHIQYWSMIYDLYSKYSFDLPYKYNRTSTVLFFIRPRFQSNVSSVDSPESSVGFFLHLLPQYGVLHHMDASRVANDDN